MRTPTSSMPTCPPARSRRRVGGEHLGGAASLGAQVAILGRLAATSWAGVFGHDIAAVGVHFATPPLDGGAPTARCLIAVTPDGQRTMSTFLGAAPLRPRRGRRGAGGRGRRHLSRRLPVRPADGPPAFRRAAAAARASARRGRPVPVRRLLRRSPPAAFLDRRRAVDILFANEAEISSRGRARHASTPPPRTRART